MTHAPHRPLPGDANTIASREDDVMTHVTQLGSHAGRIEDVPVPALLILLARIRFDGTLVLRSEIEEKTLCIDRGFPIRFEGELPSESLLSRLVTSGDLSVADLERVRSVAEQRGCHELAVVLGIEALRPELLLERLREHFWNHLEALFGATQGLWRTEPGVPTHPSLHPLRSDPYPRIHAALARQWSVDRFLERLRNSADHYTATGLTFRPLLQRLQTGRTTTSLLEKLDGHRPFGDFLAAAAGSPQTLAAAWILDVAGAFHHRENPPSDPDRDREMIEIEIVPAAERRSRRAESRHKPQPAVSEPLPPLAEQLREEILSRLRAPADVDYYALLDIDRKASPAVIKKAYLRAAKRYHPDSVGRLGLGSIKQEASDLFSRIAQAWEVLGDSDKRHNYDHSLDSGTNGLDGDRVAQAETAYRKGLVLLRKGDFAGAERFLDPAVKLWPEEANYRSALAWALYKKSPSQEKCALEQLDRALELDSQNALIHFRLGTVHRALRNANESARHFARSRELDLTNSRTRGR